ncbi:MAG: CapA family protein, partial [Lachnospiraceae bacterium]|nr:CapA family protein [Lachnospiraceae bacterium]
MKREKKRKLIFRTVGLFFGVLALVLFVGTVGMLLYAGIIQKDGENPIELVFSEDIFKSFQDILTGNSSEQKIPDDISEDERLIQEALAAGEKVIPVNSADAESVKLLFAGDILLDEHYAVMANLRDRGGNIGEAFSTELLELMQSADIFMLNNEFTFTNRGTATPGKQFTFRTNPDNVSILKEMGVDVVSVANNHIYDYGEVSLLDTLETLKNADIAYTGAGENLEEAMKPVYLIANGIKIGIISATQIERNGTPDTKEATRNSAGVLRCMNTENLLQVIAQMEDSCDYTILYIHWGTESQEQIDWLQ